MTHPGRKGLIIAVIVAIPAGLWWFVAEAQRRADVALESLDEQELPR